MFDWLTDPFSGAIAQRAALELLIVAVVCGPLGVWILLYKESYSAESISHAMLPALVIAALVNLPLLVGALVGVTVGALLIALAVRDQRLGSDIGISIVVVTLVGLGGILALAPDVPTRLSSVLFGDLLGVTATDLVASAAVSAVVISALVFLHRRLALAAFDEHASKALGASRGRSETAVLVLTGITVAMAAQVLGNLLVFGLLIGPAAAALALTTRIKRALLIAPALAGVAGLLGLLLTYHLSVAAGAAVAGCSVAVACAGVGAARFVGSGTR